MLVTQEVGIGSSPCINGDLKVQCEVENVEPRPLRPYENEFPTLRTLIEKKTTAGKKLKVCIAVEDIVGPIRNGGIGTTYTHLSRLLADEGHDVVVAYLRGKYCQNKTIDHWIKWYQGFGVKFVPVDPEDYSIESAASRWIKPMYALYDYLKEQSFDLVHVSEWRGSAFISLLAKKQGMAFEETLFCVKGSSPWLWNREYGYHTIDLSSDFPKIYAEKKSIELADLVISGSRYLLCWMLDHGYKLPEERSFVQPNVVVPVNATIPAGSQQRIPGQRIGVEEIVFFGRLEYRKGLDLFFDAIELLVLKGVKLPAISLMGKYGAKIPTHPELSIKEYIEKRANDCGIKVNVLTNLDNKGAISYLLGGNRLAVMPSRIENSTLAAYEAGYYGIPCVASDTGGTAELIQPDHHKYVLTEPHPIPLSRKINEAVDKGGFIPGASFDNNDNLQEWRDFHRTIAVDKDRITDKLRCRNKLESVKISICVVSGNNPDYVKKFVSSLKDQFSNQVEVIVIARPGKGKEIENFLKPYSEEIRKNIIIEEFDSIGEQEAQNHAASVASGDIVVFYEVGTIFKRDFLKILKKAVMNSEADVFGSFYERLPEYDAVAEKNGKISCYFMEDHTSEFYGINGQIPFAAFRKSVFEKLGGFQEEYTIPGAIRELVATASLSNFRVETIPESIVWYIDEFASTRRVNFAAEPYRTIRPFLNMAPHCYKRILMAAKADSSVEPVSFEGGIGALRGPTKFLEQQARKAANLVNDSPWLRTMGWRIFYMNIRLFRNTILFQIKVFKFLAGLKRKLSGR